MTKRGDSQDVFAETHQHALKRVRIPTLPTFTDFLINLRCPCHAPNAVGRACMNFSFSVSTPSSQRRFGIVTHMNFDCIACSICIQCNLSLESLQPLAHCILGSVLSQTPPWSYSASLSIIHLHMTLHYFESSELTRANRSRLLTNQTHQVIITVRLMEGTAFHLAVPSND